MWVSQRVQGISTALMPLYSTSIGVTRFAPPLSNLLHTENTFLLTAGASSWYRLGMLGSRQHSYPTLAWVTLVALFLLT